ncbi:MAG: polyphosphate:AMP phosphotransferase [Clostridiales bacterium]|nr:polyphosphate:AMP phosphotransferase [Clostridiales bacterium]
MLDKADLKTGIDKSDYHARMGVLEKRLESLQLKVKELGIPVIITFDGWSSAGKGTLISKALEPLDPRNFSVHSMEKVTEDQFMRPFLWRYAVKTPPGGRFAIFDKSWNTAAVIGDGAIRGHVEKDMDGICRDILAFEKQLADSGVLILKFFLHISRDEQLKRFKELEKNEDTRWRVTEKDWAQNKDYNKYYNHFDNMLKKTGAGSVKWTVIPSDDKKSAAIRFFEVLVERLTETVSMREKEKNNLATKNTENTQRKAFDDVPDILSGVSLEKDLSEAQYDSLLKQYQKHISNLGFKLYRKRRSVVIVYEGWDAAGKGGNIKRLTEELDPRGYDVRPVAAPSKEELSHHYLWRFWRDMPKDGHIAIFDRSWYGRVMVERVEGLCSEDEWRRAFNEINEMEMHLRRHGVIICKFWMHIDKDEQLRRFQARMEDPMKQYKIGGEDWRNREKWDAYLLAVNEMLAKTSTHCAPWTVVEANSKKFARIKVLERVIKTLEKEL